MRYECEQCSDMRCLMDNDGDELPMMCPYTGAIVHWEEVD